ncbi:MEDS domain-containing protein [Pullulanibacillus sp. KACC 23026]|uniref:MEDS domain-containing protein n=1 Tax=Pullulanibacillus sp. KACC 23026 TaxID=3028315 RepID=UPI0023AED8D3|nr:MEDS domain-containing protein [Pullulanibacillus sp. KACC 23026]WEG13474.1 MEDS domain-containing protein [Pullulanibacillus sp. KACC 23026]
MLELTKYQTVSNSAHILYVFNDEHKYIDNLVAYTKGGIDRGHHILLIEDYLTYQKVEKRIKSLFPLKKMENLHYIDNLMFYNYYGDFNIENIVHHFSEVLTPILKNNITVRTWARVIWRDDNGILKKIVDFENRANYSVNEMELMSVCSYSVEDVSASLQTSMMRSHEYLMTDDEFVRSSLYNK